jgi:hypothetical protein
MSCTKLRRLEYITKQIDNPNTTDIQISNTSSIFKKNSKQGSTNTKNQKMKHDKPKLKHLELM